jgi:hypothetical protein
MAKQIMSDNLKGSAWKSFDGLPVAFKKNITKSLVENVLVPTWEQQRTGFAANSVK